MRLGDVASAVGSALNTGLSADFEPIGFSIDSRTLRPGELFFAIRGEKVDGHHYVTEALARGACAAVVAEDAAINAPAEQLIQVKDTLVALQRLAQHVLDTWNRPVVAVTGSAGKTTTKDLTARLLSTRFNVLKTEGNFNNAYGLPLSVLKLISDGAQPEQFDYAVLEMGMNHAGEIRELCRIAPPTIGVVTIVAPVHLEFFESIDQIADAKAELIESLKPGGLAVLNVDDPRVSRMRQRHAGPVRTYGIEQAADVTATEIEPVGLNQTSFRLRTPNGDARIVMPLLGRHNLYNALAAATVADYVGITPGQIAEALGAAEPSKMRGQVLRFAAGFTVIDDSYNSNPRAVAEMVRAISGMSDFKRRIAVLGEMLELGPESLALHREAGLTAAQEGIDLVVGVRGDARELVEGARAGGLSEAQTRFCADAEEAAQFLVSQVREGDIVLVKGSRGVKTDIVVNRLKDAFPLVSQATES